MPRWCAWTPATCSWASWPAWLASLHGLVFYALKTFFVFFMNAMVRSIVPRYRYDQLMRLGWKVFLPTSLVAVFGVAGWLVYTGFPVAAQ